MNLDRVLDELRQKRSDLDRAIAALQAIQKKTRSSQSVRSGHKKRRRRAAAQRGIFSGYASKSSMAAKAKVLFFPAKASVQAGDEASQNANKKVTVQS